MGMNEEKGRSVTEHNARHMTSVFERYLTVWVGLCIVAGIVLG